MKLFIPSTPYLVTAIGLAGHLASNTEASQSYVSKLPNGAKVPGVYAIGHTDGTGEDGATNVFGDAFAEADYTWTKTLCMADSDGDGQTNGQELGDPCCQWVKTTNPVVFWSIGVSNPGDASKTSESSLWANVQCGSTGAPTTTNPPSPFDDFSTSHDFTAGNDGPTFDDFAASNDKAACYAGSPFDDCASGNDGPAFDYRATGNDQAACHDGSPFDDFTAGNHKAAHHDGPTFSDFTSENDGTAARDLASVDDFTAENDHAANNVGSCNKLTPGNDYSLSSLSEHANANVEGCS